MKKPRKRLWTETTIGTGDGQILLKDIIGESGYKGKIENVTVKGERTGNTVMLVFTVRRRVDNPNYAEELAEWKAYRKAIRDDIEGSIKELEKQLKEIDDENISD